MNKVLKKSAIFLVLAIFLAMTFVVLFNNTAYAEIEYPDLDIEVDEDLKPMTESVNVTYSYIIDQNSIVTYRYKIKFNPDLLYFSLPSLKNYSAIQLAELLRNVLKLQGYKVEKVDMKKPNVVVGEISCGLTELYIQNGVTGNEKGEVVPLEDVNFFFQKYTSNQSNFVKSLFEKNADNDNGLSKFEIILQNMRELSGDKLGFRIIDKSKFVFNYVYGTHYKNVTSNSNEVVKKDSVYLHKFYNINEETVMTTEKQIPNSRNWYILLAIVAIVIVIVGSLVVYLKKNSNTKKNI